jgi:hypothetical protein
LPAIAWGERTCDASPRERRRLCRARRSCPPRRRNLRARHWRYAAGQGALDVTTRSTRSAADSALTLARSAKFTRSTPKAEAEIEARRGARAQSDSRRRRTRSESTPIEACVCPGWRNRCSVDIWFNHAASEALGNRLATSDPPPFDWARAYSRAAIKSMSLSTGGSALALSVVAGELRLFAWAWSPVSIVPMMPVVGQVPISVPMLGNPSVHAGSDRASSFAVMGLRPLTSGFGSTMRDQARMAALHPAPSRSRR